MKKKFSEFQMLNNDLLKLFDNLEEKFPKKNFFSNMNFQEYENRKEVLTIYLNVKNSIEV